MRKRACFLACLALLIVLLESPSQALLRVQNNVPTLTISGTRREPGVSDTAKM